MKLKINLFKKNFFRSIVPRFRISLLSGISISVLSIVFFSSTLLAFVFYVGMRHAAFLLGHTNLKTIERNVEENVYNYFHSAESTLSVASNTIVKTGVVKSKKGVEDILWSYILLNENINSIYYAFADTGDSILVKRMSDGSFSVRSVIRGKDKVVQIWDHEKPKFNDIYKPVTHYAANEGYNAKERGWYLAAVKNERPLDTPRSAIWTPPYIFRSDQKMGITIAKRLVVNKDIKGVLGIDLTIEKISLVLSSLDFIKRQKGFIFISDAERNILAASFPTVNGKVRINQKMLWKIERKPGQENKLMPIIDYEVRHPLIQGVVFTKNYHSGGDLFSDQGFFGKEKALKKSRILHKLYKLKIANLLNDAVSVAYENYYSFFFRLFGKDELTKLANHYEFKTAKERYTSFTQDKESYLVDNHTLFVSPSFPIKLSIVFPFNLILGPLNQVLLLTSVLVFVLIFFAFLFSFAFARSIALPIRGISEGMRRIKNFELEVKSTTKGDIEDNVFREITDMQDAYVSMEQGLISFKKYVPTEIVSQLIKQGEEANVGGKDAKISILFSDIVGFTTLTEKTASNVLINQLRTYFNVVSHIISEYEGTLDKYIGDAVMAFWGAPTPSTSHAAKACLATLMCRNKIKAINENFVNNGLMKFLTRFGINTGEAIVGNVGSDARLNYTAIGDSVNLASRLEALNKFYGTEILISEDTYLEAKDFVEARLVDQVVVVGKEESVRVYELIGKKGQIEKEQRILIESFQEAFSKVEKRQWSQAVHIFNKVSLDHPKDKVSRILLDRCYSRLENKELDDEPFVYYPKKK